MTEMLTVFLIIELHGALKKIPLTLHSFLPLQFSTTVHTEFCAIARALAVTV